LDWERLLLGEGIGKVKPPREIWGFWVLFFGEAINLIGTFYQKLGI